MLAKPTTVTDVAKEEHLMLARDGSDRVEACRGATAISVGLAISAAKAGAAVDAFISPACREYLTAAESARLDRAIDEGRKR